MEFLIDNGADVHRAHPFSSSGGRNPIRHDRAAFEARAVEVMAKGLLLFFVFLFFVSHSNVFNFVKVTIKKSN